MGLIKAIHELLEQRLLLLQLADLIHQNNPGFQQEAQCQPVLQAVADADTLGEPAIRGVLLLQWAAEGRLSSVCPLDPAAFEALSSLLRLNLATTLFHFRAKIKIVIFVIMNKKDYEALLKALQKQRREVTSSKKAARKFLKDAGVLHLLVPKGTNKSSAALSK